MIAFLTFIPLIITLLFHHMASFSQIQLRNRVHIQTYLMQLIYYIARMELCIILDDIASNLSVTRYYQKKHGRASCRVCGKRC